MMTALAKTVILGHGINPARSPSDTANKKVVGASFSFTCRLLHHVTIHEGHDLGAGAG